MQAKILNYVLYQAGWTCCVLGAAYHHPRVGTTLAMGLLAVHLLLADRPRAEFRLIAMAAATGFAADTILGWAGVVRFSSGYIVPWLAPPWIVLMWMQFASTFRYSLGWLVVRPWLAAVLGALGGPAAYWAGSRLGAVTLGPDLRTAFIALAVVWATALPLLLLRARGTGEGGYRLPRRFRLRSPSRRG